MDHSGLDRELINSPSACWDSRQGDLSASSVSGRALGQFSCRLTAGFKQGPLDPSLFEWLFCEFGRQRPRLCSYVSLLLRDTGKSSNCPAD